MNPETMRRHYVAFRKPLAAGRYEQVPFPVSGPEIPEVRAFCRNEGDGFYSLVRSEHGLLITMEVLKTTVSRIDKPWTPEFKTPDPAVGDRILVVVPPEDFAEWDDATVDETWGDPGGAPPRKLPVPSCRLEVWTRLE